jgi:hypothetical protein
MKKTEVMHIYNGRTTFAAGNAYNFTEKDFTRTIPYTTESGEVLRNILTEIATEEGTDFTIFFERGWGRGLYAIYFEWSFLWGKVHKALWRQ